MAFPVPPLDSSILAYNPYFPNGVVSGDWAAYFTALEAVLTSGPVTSFNGRFGVVTPQTGDYTVSQVTGAAPIASPAFTGASSFTGTVSFSGATVSGVTAAEVTFTQSATGAVAGTVDSSLKDKPYDAVTDFGCDNTGATNCTTAMLAFFNACINNQHEGYIPAGTYLITAGQLAFDNGFTDKNFPTIRTAGHLAVTFKRADATNAAMIALTNGTATSGVGNYWQGGFIGGITFDQNGQTTNTGQHGIDLRGVYGLRLGWMTANNLGGSCVHIPLALYGGSNPDPYAVTFVYFEAIEANSCGGAALLNENYVGLNLCTVNILRAITTTLGGWIGLGAGNACLSASVASVQGWAFDDGTNVDHTGGAPSRFYMGLAEIDNAQNGIRLNTMTNIVGFGIRFVHRYQTTPNVSAVYWPLTSIDLTGGSGPNNTNIGLQIIHRIEAGGTKGVIGTFLDAHSSGNNTNVNIDQHVIDNAGFGFADTDLYANIPATTGTVTLTRDGHRIFDSQLKEYVRAEATAATTIPNSGFTTTKIQFPTEASDRNGLYNAADTYTVPFTGNYRVRCLIALTAAAGTRIRMAVMKNTTLIAERYAYAATAAVQHYPLEDVIACTAGDTLWMSIEQNTATSTIAVSTPNNAGIDNHFIIEPV